ncbi:MAG: hypothetical protein A3H28_14585 [Acidobacteria bacterium RIFCSPLOWO2_02_FULL_61_28]|nr:MAG: hypothetical protein A3H28_14585 [Acidobacteria bacterium RIFCSPLOWO2_02_FULL_61_28]
MAINKLQANFEAKKPKVYCFGSFFSSLFNRAEKKRLMIPSLLPLALAQAQPERHWNLGFRTRTSRNI